MSGLENQLSIESLITAPLVAASKANVVMVTGQTRALLENCFVKTQESVYEPVMIKMSLTRGVVQTEATSSESELIRPVTLTFHVPLICLIPINNIVVEKVSVEFDMEVTATAPKQQKSVLPGANPVVDDKAVLLGKISRRSPSPQDGHQMRSSSNLTVKINAGPLPLSPGLHTILDLYTKSVTPVGSKASCAEAAAPKAST